MSDLADTIIALEGGAANIPADAALADVEGWIARLQGVDLPHADELRDALRELAMRLSRNDLKDIGEVLARIANLVTALVPYAPGTYRNDLLRLADLLHVAAVKPI